MLLSYLGELVGMVGSMETKAPSGSTIMMAVFLWWEEDKILGYVFCKLSYLEAKLGNFNNQTHKTQLEL